MQTEGPAMTVQYLYRTLKSINAQRAAYLLKEKAHDIYEQHKRSASESQAQGTPTWCHANSRDHFHTSASFSYGYRHNHVPSFDSEADAEGCDVTAVPVSQTATTISQSYAETESIEFLDTESPRHV